MGALDLASQLLGKLFRRGDVILQITEVEAYRQNVTACHGRFGITPRTAPLFGPGGYALCLHVLWSPCDAQCDGRQGRNWCSSLNPVMTCVRLLAFAGLETIQKRRGQRTERPILLTGAGKIGQALGLSTTW